MPKLLKEALSTRKALQKKPNIDLIKELSDEDVKALQGVFLEMLKDLDRVCAEHHITYMAAGGTALGAVRHKGFIPWDDDVDILMPRKDLDRFVEIFDGAMGEKYGLTSPNTKYMLESNISAIYKKHTRKVSFEAYNTPYPKGIHVDIFAIETVPMNPLVRRIKGTVAMGLQFIAVSTRFYHYRSAEKKRYFYQSTAGKINWNLRCVTGAMFSFLSYETWGNLFDRFVRGPKESRLWAVPTDIGHYFGHIMPKSVYYPPKKMKFEDMELYVPRDTDTYLRNQYGDYWTIPPVEDREKHYSVEFSLYSEEE